MELLSGKVAIITGGGKGIGRGITNCFLEAGAKVMIAQRSELDPPIVATNEFLDCRKVNMADARSIAELVPATISRFGRRNDGSLPAITTRESVPRRGKPWLRRTLGTPRRMATTPGQRKPAMQCGNCSKSIARCFSSPAARRPMRWHYRHCANRITAFCAMKWPTSKPTNAAPRSSFPTARKCSW